MLFKYINSINNIIQYSFRHKRGKEGFTIDHLTLDRNSSHSVDRIAGEA
jgi:hypothetical protein